MSTTAVAPSANEATAAAPATTALPAKQPTPPKPGDLVRIRKIFGAGTGVERYATVLTVAPSLPSLVGEDGMPTVTVAFVKDEASIGILGSGNWHQAFDRVANVAPASHKEVKAGARGIFWVDVLPAAGQPIAADSFASADLPQVEGRESTVFSREKAEEFFERPAKVVPPAVEPVNDKPKAEPEATENGAKAAEDSAPGGQTEAPQETKDAATAPEPEKTQEPQHTPEPAPEPVAESNSSTVMEEAPHGAE